MCWGRERIGKARILGRRCSDREAFFGNADIVTCISL
jgi:hypothetical protein